jgi:alpha-galactosidase
MKLFFSYLPYSITVAIISHMITNTNTDFLLSTATTSLLLHVNEIKKLTSEYYGARLLDIAEAPSLIRQYPCNQGTSLSYDEAHANLSLDFLKNEVSTAGKGDYGMPSLILSRGEDGVFDFVYDSFVIQEPKPLAGTADAAWRERRIGD